MAGGKIVHVAVGDLSARESATIDLADYDVLALAAEKVANGATQFKCGPPVRDAVNCDRFWQALADGVIDFVVSDHSPAPRAEATGQRRLLGRPGRYFVVATRAVGGLD